VISGDENIFLTFLVYVYGMNCYIINITREVSMDLNILSIALMFAAVVYGVRVANQEFDEAEKNRTK
jgi:hypothetical protein